MSQVKEYIILILLIISCIMDIKYRKIPNKILFPYILGGIFYSIFSGGIKGLFLSVISIIIVFLIFVIPFIIGEFGGGDIKLLMAIASFTNPIFVFYLIIYTGIIGGVMALVMIIIKKELKGFLIKMKNKLIIVTNCNRMNIKEESEKTYIPYAIAISLGTILTNILIK